MWRGHIKSKKSKILVGFLGFLLIEIFIWRFVASPHVVVGDSMLPTLQTWDFCLMHRWGAYQPQRGDIVMFRTADDPPLYFIKRVVALPGETIAIAHGNVSINGQPLPEPYTTPNPTWMVAPTNVPPGRVYVIGDNRSVFMDDAVQGLVATRLVTGRMIWHWRWR